MGNTVVFVSRKAPQGSTWFHYWVDNFIFFKYTYVFIHSTLFFKMQCLPGTMLAYCLCKHFKGCLKVSKNYDQLLYQVLSQYEIWIIKWNYSSLLKIKVIHVT